MARLKKLKFENAEHILEYYEDNKDEIFERTYKLLREFWDKHKFTDNVNIYETEVETFKENITTTNDNSFIKTPNKNNQKFNDIELPPKGQKIELEEFIEPANIICKCGPEEICPICEEEKDLTY